MQVRTVRGRRYSDPDVLRLIAASDGLDPRAIVAAQAAELLSELDQFSGGFDTPLERICALASLAGYQVKAMDLAQSLNECRDAVIVATPNDGRRGLILYNPSRAPARIVHSIAHEICHSFFPNSRYGAQFRSVHRGDGAPPELELLCDHGAAELTMPRADFVQAMREFGTDLSAAV